MEKSTVTSEFLSREEEIKKIFPKFKTYSKEEIAKASSKDLLEIIQSYEDMHKSAGVEVTKLETQIAIKKDEFEVLKEKVLKELGTIDVDELQKQQEVILNKIDQLQQDFIKPTL